MPNPTPIGGISLIAHLAINIAAFAYKRTKSFVLSRWPWIGQKAEETFARFEQGILVWRGMVAYAIIIGMFSFFVGLSMFIFSRSLGSPVITFASKTAHSVYIAVSKNQIFAERPVVEENEIDEAKKPELSEFDASDLDRSETMSYRSVVDLLDAAHFEKSTLQFRATLAKRFGIVRNEADYKGTAEQNVKLLEAIKDLIANGGSIPAGR